MAPAQVQAITTADYPTPARRPLNSRLDTGRLQQAFGLSLPGWQQALLGHRSNPVEMFDSSSDDVARIVREKTGGHGADIVFNTVGSPFFEMANNALAKQGRQVFISTFDRAVPFDIFNFFRGRHKYIGIDTLALSSVDGARIFDKLKPKFEAGILKPFPINPASVHRFEDAAKAYASVLRGNPDRVLLKP